MINIDKEYDALRQELLQWQDNRFKIIALNATVISVILGWLITKPCGISWVVVSTLLIWFNTCACYLLLISNRFINRIGTYIEVFCENETGYENRNGTFHNYLKTNFFMRFHSSIVFIYLGLTTISIIIPYKVCPPSPLNWYLTFLGIILVVFLTIIILMIKAFPRQKYVDLWKRIKEEEMLEKQVNE